MIFGDSEAEIYVNIGFYMAAILKPQDECYDIIGGGGYYQKYKPKTMRSLWKKFDAFVRNVHIHPRFVIKLPDYKTCSAGKSTAVL